jgi:RNA polymerase sigma factor (sigma-70 family)
MTDADLGTVVGHLRQLIGPPTTKDNDASLLARFLASRDEAAFAALLRCHGPMVYGVCRRLLHRDQDAEDVVQAVFLLLARKGATIRKRASLASWLHGVAQRLCIGLKRQEMNRLRRQKQTSLLRKEANAQHFCGTEIQELLDIALHELPEKYRAALILCCLEGRTQEEAATRLGCPLGTVRSRLARGRGMLRRKLALRGLALSAGALATLLTAQTSTASLPVNLFDSALHAAVQYSSGQALPGLVSPTVALLVNAGLKPLGLSKMAWLAAGVLTLGLLVGSASWAANSRLAEVEETLRPQQQTQAKQPVEPEVDKPSTDLYGDPLPAQALLRLGTVRLRHADLVRNLGFSPDGSTILSADWYGVHIWDASSGRRLRRFGDPGARHFQSIAASADIRFVALTLSDGDVEIWDASTGRMLRQFQVGRIPHVVLSPDGSVLAVCDHAQREGKEVETLRLFDASTGIERCRLQGHQDRIHTLLFSKDGKTLVTSSDDRSIRFWDVATGKQVRQLDHAAPVGSIALAPDNKMLASVAMKKEEYNTPASSATTWKPAEHVVLWDLASGKDTLRLDGHKNGVFALIFAPDGKTLLSSDSKTVHCWNVTTGQELLARNLQIPWLLQMAFSPDGTTLATGGQDGVVQLWDWATGKQKLPLGGHEAAVLGVAVSPDGRTFATAGRDKLIRLWDATSGKQTRQLAGHEKDIWSLTFVPDGRMLLSTELGETVCVWSIVTGKEVHRFPGSRAAALSPDGKTLVTCGKDKCGHVWEMATGQELRRWPLTDSAVTELAFSTDGRTIFSWGEDQQVRLWDFATGKELRHFAGHAFRKDDRVYCVAFSPDGKLVALAGQTGEIALYDMAKGKLSRLLTGLTKPVYSLAFSADSRVLASGEWPGGTVHLWEMAAGKEFQQFTGHEGGVFNMAFSADGKVLVTSNQDTTALVWDLTGTRTGPKAPPLTAKEVEAAWSDLADANAGRGQGAVRTLLAAPNLAMELFKKELRPAIPTDAKRLARLISDLDSEVFKVREEAKRELEKFGDVAEPTLRDALAAAVSLEHKQRLECILKSYSTFQRRRTLRAVQALELLGTQPSRELLGRLADGVPEALLTRESKAALGRLAKRGIETP